MKTIAVLAITETENLWFPSVSTAARHFGISKYRLLTCYFTDTGFNGVYFDLDLRVSDLQEAAVMKSWRRTKSTSQNRRIYGKPEKKL